MRKIIVGAFISLDGVLQGPGGPTEDPSGGFDLGGWLVPHFDEAVGAAMGELMGRPFDLLLGRRTYDILRAHWPVAAQRGDETGLLFNRITKFVATRDARADLGWQNTTSLGPDVVASLGELKQSDGPDLITQGSGNFLQTLFRAGLVDELTTFTFPVMLGKGKRLFDPGFPAAAVRLASSSASPSGVVISRYTVGGVIPRGSLELA